MSLWVFVVGLALSLTLLPSSASARPRPSTSADISMREAVRVALRKNPSLEGSRAEARASEEGRKSARGAFGPKFGLTYSAMKQVRKSEPVPTRTPELGAYTMGLEVSQPLFQGFRLLADYQKAALQAESDRLAVRQARLELIERVQTTFVDFLLARANVESQREDVARLAEQVRIAKALHDVGLAPKLDVLQAEVDLSESEQLLLEHTQTVETLHAQLNTILGRPATDLTSYSGRLAFVSFSPTLERCLERAYRRRPDLRMARLAVDIAGKDRMSVQAGYYPKIEAYYNITNAGNTPDLQMDGPHGSRSSTWEAGAKLTWDVFQWGTTYYADQRARELVTKMRFEEKNLQLEVGYDLKAKFLALREAENRIGVARRGIASAGEAYRSALARYREQVGTGYDVLTTSSKLTQARFSLNRAFAEYMKALSALFAAMGEEHEDLLS